MRLSIDLVRRAPQFTNTLLQREIDLCGLRISSLDEHVLVLLDNNFDVLNLSSNALTALEYFPTKSTTGGKDVRMSRVTTLIAHRNEIQRASVASCAQALPNVAHFVADRNRFAAVRDLCFLKHWKKLEMLSLEENPVWSDNAEQYDEAKLRAFLVFLCPRLKLINYQRVTQADRECAVASKKEFKELVVRWEGALSGPGLSSSGAGEAEGKKPRKRGREGRAAAAVVAASAVLEEVIASPSLEAEVTAPATTSAVAEEAVSADEDDVLQARLDQLEERLLSDDVTAEEMAQLEEEMTEISAKMAAARKRKRR